MSHQCPCWGGYKGVEGVGPSQQEKSPEVTGKQDVGNILDYTVSVTGWGEEKVWDAGKEAWTRPVRGLPAGADVVMGRQGVLLWMRPKADKDWEM